MAMASLDQMVQNIITLIVIIIVLFLIMSKIKKENLKDTMARIKGLFGGKKDGG